MHHILIQFHHIILAWNRRAALVAENILHPLHIEKTSYSSKPFKSNFFYMYMTILVGLSLKGLFLMLFYLK